MWLTRSLLLVGVLALPSVESILLKDLNVSSVTNVLEAWVNTGVETEVFKEVTGLLSLPSEMRTKNWNTFAGDRGLAICTICRSVVRIAISSRRAGASAELIKDKVIRLCTLLNLQTKEVCTGVVESNAPILMYIIDAKPNLTPDTFCGLVFQKGSCVITDEEYEWTIDLDDNNDGWSRRPSYNNGSEISEESIKVLQITDIHYDPNYEPYGNADCSEPTCCRAGQNQTNKVGKLAGYWGDYDNCDTPWHAVVDALEHINTTHRDLTYVYFTGDIIDHGVWETTRTGNVESLRKSYAAMYDTFPKVPIYPIVGNHEPHPLNLFAPESIVDDRFGTQWLYNMLADIWIDFGWLPEAARSTIQRGGFYSYSPRKGLRIVALNNNVCYCYNWWLLYEPRDPSGQLRWLADTLLRAEENGEFVHILGHIPPGDRQCYSTWKREYLKIVKRFARIITAQFNGHTHNDEVQMIYDKGDDVNAINVAWNGGGITSYSNLNPNYKVFTINANNYAVMDYDNWMYNLTLANENPAKSPHWYKAYSFKDEYGTKDLSLDSLSNWVVAMSNDATSLMRYHRNFFKQAEPSLKKGCDLKCLKSYVHRITVKA